MMATTEQFYGAPVGTYGNAVLSWRKLAAEDVVLYAVSYRNAAHNLIYIHSSRELGDIDHSACPVIFLYRHSIELYLKAMLYRLARLSVDDTDLREVLPRLWREHSLLKLLKMAQPVLEAMYERLPLALRVFDEDELKFLGDLDRIDPGSYSFRYPVASTGGPSLPKMLITNIFVFAEMADRTLDALNARCRFLIDEVDALEPQLRLSLDGLKARANP